MQELAHKGTGSPPGSGRLSGILPPYTGGHPSAEMLAAYIDRVLDPGEAERITAHLADCEDCYAVYAESLQFLLEAGPEEGEGTVVPFRRPSPKVDRRPWHKPWAQIAALLLVGVGAGSLYFLWEPPTLKTAEVAAPIPNRPEVFEDSTGIWTGPIYRGGEGEPEVNLDEAAFRTGVQLVNLQVSLKAGKTVEAQNAIAAILGLLEAGILTDELETKYEGLTGSLDEGRPASSFLPVASQLAEETREVFEEESLDFGQWVEAGRLAAATGDPSFFQQRGTQSFLRRLLWRDKLGLGKVQLGAKTRQSLEEVSQVISKSDLQPSDYAKLSDLLEQILEEHYPAS
jgi:hypothetical protein